MIVRILIIALVLLTVGCKPSGLASTKTDSSGLATVAERQAFLERYVTFRRTYESLDFNLYHQNNNGGLVSGPSDWDVRLVAIVPEAELQAWLPTGVKPSPVGDIEWLKSVPTSLDLSGIDEWYVDGGKTVGLDRKQRLVVYRLLVY